MSRAHANCLHKQMQEKRTKQEEGITNYGTISLCDLESMEFQFEHNKIPREK